MKKSEEDLKRMKAIDKIVIYCLRKRLFKKAVNVMKDGASMRLVNMVREACVKRGLLYMYMEIAGNVPGSRIPRREELKRIALVNLRNGNAKITLQAVGLAKCSLLSKGCRQLAANMKA